MYQYVKYYQNIPNGLSVMAIKLFYIFALAVLFITIY